MKRCMTRTGKGCGRTLPMEMFYASRPTFCIDCTREQSSVWAKENAEAHNARGKKWRSTNPDKSIAIRRKNRYAVTQDWWDVTLAAQNGHCATCDSTTKLSVDHDHSCCPGRTSCGKCVRGILCGNCNTVLGLFNDDPKIIRSAIAYLESRNGF
jgi:hypothetical protein